MYLDALGEPTDRSLTGHLAAGVPGAVAGLTEAQHRFGRLPFAQVIAPAIRLAREGFLVDEYRSQSIAGDSARLARFPASRASFLPDGAPPAAGTRAAPARSGHHARGDPRSRRGRLLPGAGGGPDRGRDGARRRPDHRMRTSASYRPIWRDPVRIQLRGYTIYSMPPASSGGVTMGEILNIMEGYDPLPPFGSPALVHLEAEAMRRAFTDRNTWLGDPAFVTTRSTGCSRKEYAAASPAGDRAERASPTPAFAPGPRDRRLDHPLLGRGRRGERGRAARRRSTTAMAAR